MKRLLRKLRRDDRGVAAVEFALWSVFIFSVLLVGFDFGIYSLQRARLAKSVSEASNFAFATRKAVDVTQIQNYITSSSDLPGTAPTVGVTCNVGEVCRDDNRSCACLGSDGALTASATCATPCTNGTKSGYYMSIEASYVYQAPVLPNGFLDGLTMREHSTVQLQ